VEWLLYHLANVLQLTLATREAIARLVRSERKLSTAGRDALPRVRRQTS
jgi:hypothetical protein